MGVAIYADGGFHPARGAGWAWIAVDLETHEQLAEDHGRARRGSPHLPRGAYNVEVYAVMRALESDFAAGSTVRTDAKNLVSVLDDANRRPLNRLELRVSELLQGRGARLEYVPRDCDEWMERTDRLANRRRNRNPGRKSKHRRIGR